jgi:hypothetical protein
LGTGNLYDLSPQNTLGQPWRTRGVVKRRDSSTASIGYIFLPFEVLVAMTIGYTAGRLVAKLRSVPS